MAHRTVIPGLSFASGVAVSYHGMVDFQATWVDRPSSLARLPGWGRAQSYHGLLRHGVVVFTAGPFTACAAMSGPNITVYVPTSCCGALSEANWSLNKVRVRAQDLLTYSCLQCGGEADASANRWTQPYSPAYTFDAVLADWLADRMGILESCLVLPDIKARMETVFKAKVLLRTDGADHDKFLTLLHRVSGPVSG